MKVEFKKAAPTTFYYLTRGDTFVFKEEVWMKIRLLQNLCDEKINAVCLNDGTAGYIDSETSVLRFIGKVVEE